MVLPKVGVPKTPPAGVPWYPPGPWPENRASKGVAWPYSLTSRSPGMVDSSPGLASCSSSGGSVVELCDAYITGIANGEKAGSQCSGSAGLPPVLQD